MVEAVTVGDNVTAADPEEVMDPEVEDVPVFVLVACDVTEPVAVVDAVLVFVVVAAGLLDPVGLLLAVTVAVAREEPDPEGVPEAVGAVDPVLVRVTVLD